jgi:hypothetical protein
MTPRRLPALAALLVLFVLPACREATAPSVPLGIFVLHDIAGTAPPVTYDWGLDGTLSVLGDTIELDGAGTAIRALRIRRTGSIYWQVDTVYDVYTAQRPQQYRLDGTRIEIGSFQPCPINAFCVANDTGRLEGAVLTLGSFLGGQPRSWRYERVAPLPQ